MSGLEAHEPNWDNLNFASGPAGAFDPVAALEQLDKEAQTQPVLASLELFATDRGFISFVEAGYARSRGRPLRRLTADMLETRLNLGEWGNPDDAIFARRVEDLFKANKSQYDDEKSSWDKRPKQNKTDEPPLSPEDRIRIKIEELREIEAEIQFQADERKRLKEEHEWMAGLGILYPDPTIEPTTVSGMRLGDLERDQWNVSNEDDSLEDHPGLQKFREVLVESTYDQIEGAVPKIAPNCGYKREYLRNCVEQGVNTMLIASILTPEQFKRKDDPQLLVDAGKLENFQNAVKEVDSSEANSLTPEEAEQLAAELLIELTAKHQKGWNLSTTPLNITKTYKGLKAALFNFETIVLHDKGYLQPWEETCSLATLFGGMLAVCALTNVLERQGGRLVEIPV